MTASLSAVTDWRHQNALQGRLESFSLWNLLQRMCCDLRKSSNKYHGTRISSCPQHPFSSSTIHANLPCYSHGDRTCDYQEHPHSTAQTSRKHDLYSITGAAKSNTCKNVNMVQQNIEGQCSASRPSIAAFRNYLTSRCY